jgi:hypothetical protein
MTAKANVIDIAAPAMAAASPQANPIDTQALRPIACGTMVRLGSPNDGGYVVPLDAIKNAGALVSFGLRFDWNFERDFRRLNPQAVVHCYDHTVSSRGALFFSATETLRFLTNFRPRTLRSAMTWFDYRGFFRGDVKHFQQRVWRDRSRNSVTVGDALARVQGRRPIFLKIDIEGSEYRIMDDVLDNADIIGAIAIEFHDLDISPERFNETVAALREKFHVVHLHANNYADLSPFDFPGAVEITFLNKALLTQEPVISAQRYPLAGLDQPNDPAMPDYEFHFRT